MAPLEQLRSRLAEVADLERASAVLGWDQETYMPAGGAGPRAEQLATLSGLAHEKSIDPAVGKLLGELETEMAGRDPEDDDAALVRVARREYDKKVKLPPELVAERTRVTSLAVNAWRQAREANDWEAFRPHLEKVLDLTRQVAEKLGYEECMYDALLDQFEPEVRRSQVAAVLAELKEGLVPFVRRVLEKADAVDDAMFSLAYDEDAQWAFGEEVVRKLGYDFERGRQDRSAHPFTTSFSPSDVRITTRLDAHQLRMALFGTIHEAGHAMYEQGLPEHLDRTPLCAAASLGIHESQSRLWENVVGRGRPFWSHFYPRLQEIFPTQLGAVSLDDFYRAINRVTPSFIRVEADEVTYDLHVMLRFEIEDDILEGRVELKDLPDLWNAKMDEYLGIVPGSDAEGVLQDIHWSWGLIGYFPTYTLGSLVSVQLYDTACTAHPEIPERMAAGDFAPLLGWLRENVHARGSKDTPWKLVERVTGGPISPAPFLRYLEGKYGEIYGL
jgi:carboxypeptidase Taq